MAHPSRDQRVQTKNIFRFIISFFCDVTLQRLLQFLYYYHTYGCIFLYVLQAGSGTTTRGRKKTISLDPPHVSVHPADRNAPMPSKRPKLVSILKILFFIPLNSTQKLFICLYNSLYYHCTGHCGRSEEVFVHQYTSIGLLVQQLQQQQIVLVVVFDYYFSQFSNNSSSSSSSNV